MTYSELLIALDIGDPKNVLCNLVPKQCNRKYFVVCDDGDIHCFDKNGKEQRIDYIPHCCFVNQPVEKIIIPESATYIDTQAFCECNSLKNVTIPNSVKSIREMAFYSCDSLTSVTIPDGVTSIDGWAFYWSIELIDVIIGSNVKNIGYKAFAECYSLKSIVFKGKTMEQIKAMDNYPWGVDDKCIIKAGL